MAETENPFAQSPALSIAELEARMEGSRAQRERHARLRNILYPFAVVIGLLVVWEVLGHLELLLDAGLVAERTGDAGSLFELTRGKSARRARRSPSARLHGRRLAAAHQG